MNRVFRCNACGAEVELETDGRWLAPKGWVWRNEQLVCNEHRRVVITNGNGRKPVVRISTLD